MADEPKKYARKSAATKKREAREQPTSATIAFRKGAHEVKDLAQAAIAAGNSPKNASQSEHQALARLKVPDMLSNASYSIPVINEKHLAPKRYAKTIKLAIAEANSRTS